MQPQLKFRPAIEPMPKRRRWPAQYDELGNYQCPKPLLLVWALLLVGSAYLCGWVFL
jgi:hypothetical protein